MQPKRASDSELYLAHLNETVDRASVRKETETEQLVVTPRFAVPPTDTAGARHVRAAGEKKGRDEREVGLRGKTPLDGSSTLALAPSCS